MFPAFDYGAWKHISSHFLQDSFPSFATHMLILAANFTTYVPALYSYSGDMTVRKPGGQQL